VIVAAKRRTSARDTARWCAVIEAHAPQSAARGSSAPLRVTAKNTGAGIWRARSQSGVGDVTLGVQLLDAEGRIVARDYHRVRLPEDVTAGQSVTLSFDCPVPAEAGHYQLKLDLVAEGVTWFEAAGSVPVSKSLLVT
jgi:hypothetical protein